MVFNTQVIWTGDKADSDQQDQGDTRKRTGYDQELIPHGCLANELMFTNGAPLERVYPPSQQVMFILVISN